ncbi:9963_t:CDS:2 [Acaulospora morrowiae]|uniref:9963_t:CDS:1 n=1 Tax=Acaulospora morrowiae TaxID=94023 RepID=A0A9N8WLM4_9GLOM|nr:9963_t:CDS:2 [Acaulospora morrowiae]
MPMIDHFRNFIRHGKQANQKLISQENNTFDSNATDNNRIYPEVKSKVDNATAVAQIVAEEREQKNKIPTYPGLERYRILEKMGEGAFSNVYKAIDTETKEKVAIKVVRKRELNYSQESGIFDYVEYNTINRNQREIQSVRMDEMVMGDTATTSVKEFKNVQSHSCHLIITVRLYISTTGVIVGETFTSRHEKETSCHRGILLFQRCQTIDCYVLTAKSLAFVKLFPLIKKYHNFIFDIENANSQKFLRSNILKEVQIMRQLKHPSIISLISFSESSEYYYLVLELMEGGELFNQIVKLTYFSEPLSRHVIVQVAEGIKYLHEESGIVHRDIKPENLLFEPIPIFPSKEPRPPPGPNDEPKEDEGEFIPGVGGGGIGKVKIADFGLSKVVWDEKTMTPCGTVGYTAPEIVKDERYSKSVDMWALGCVLYTLLCGFPPFYDESIQELTKKVEKGQYTFLSPWWDDISLSAKDLITNLLTVDPDKRYTIKQFFEHPWVKDEPFHPKPSLVPVDRSINKVTSRSIDANQLASVVEPPLMFEEILGTPGEGVRRGGKLGALNPFRNKFVHQMNDDDDHSDEDEEISSSSNEQVTSREVPNEPVKMKSGSKNSKEKSRRVAIELNLEGATLLGRRRKIPVGV